MLTLFPRPKPSPPKPLEPEPQNQAPVPLESAPESTVVEPPVTETTPGPIAIDEAAADVAISAGESVAIEESAAVAESVAPDALSAEEESIAVEAQPVEENHPETVAEEADTTDAMESEVVHTMPLDIAAIVDEISTRIHSPKPIALEVPPAEPRHAEKVSAIVAEEDSELIEWDVIELSSPETPVADPAVGEVFSDFEAVQESHAAELPKEESVLAEEIGKSI